MNNITLKLATEKDISVYFELEKSIVHSKTYSFASDENEVKEEFRNNIIYFIQNNDEIVGSIQYEIKNLDYVSISGLIVSSKFQGRGIGSEAFEQILEKIKDLKRIDLVTHPDNIPALKLYKTFGFVVESRVEDYYGDGEPRLILSKMKL